MPPFEGKSFKKKMKEQQFESLFNIFGNWPIRINLNLVLILKFHFESYGEYI